MTTSTERTPAYQQIAHRHEVSCATLTLEFNYLRSRLGDYARVTEGVLFPLSYLEDENNWIDYESFRQILKNIRALFPDDPSVMRNIGRSILEHEESYRSIRMLAVLIWNPKAVYARVPSFAKKTFSFIKADFVAEGPTAATIVYRFDPGYEPTRDFLEHVCGLFEIIPVPAGFPESTVEYALEGQEARFRIQWSKERTRRFWRNVLERVQVFKRAQVQIDENKRLIEAKYREVEAANLRIRQQVERLTRLRELGALTGETLDEGRMEANLLRFFSKNLKITDALFFLDDQVGNWGLRWAIKAGTVWGHGATSNALPLLTPNFLAAIRDVQRVRQFQRRTGVFAEQPDLYPLASAFLVVPIVLEERTLGCLVLPQESADEDPEKMNFFEAIATEVGLALGRVLAVKELDQLKNSLEEKVADRTAELNKAKAEIQESYRKLRIVDRMRSEFVMNVTFELRNPMNLILAPIQLVLTGKTGQVPAEVREQVEVAQRNSLVLLKNINHLLDLHKLDNLNVYLDYRQVSPAELLAAAAEVAERYAAEKEIEVVQDVPPGLPEVLVDPEKIGAALHALLANAVKFTPLGGTITVRGALEGEWVRLDVQDTGIGIAKDKRSLLFERFHQLNDPMQKEYRGIGVGLSVAHEFVTLHKGRISVESEEGRGSIFSVHLPLGDAHVDERLRERRQRKMRDLPYTRRQQDVDKFNISQFISDKGTLEYIDVVNVRKTKLDKLQRFSLMHRKTVLFVFPDASFTDVAQTILLDYVNVLTAQNGDEAWSMVQAHKPDLVVTAPVLFGMNGIDLIRRVRARPDLASTPIIMLSEKFDLYSRMEGIEQGADMYMAVPLDFNELLAHIRSLLEMQELRQKLVLAKASLEERVSSLVEDREKLFMGIIEALALAIDEKDRYTHGHSARVREVTGDFARYLGLAPQVVAQLEFSAILHDIGKIGIPEGVLNKAGRLDDAEWHVIRSHPIRGVKILGAIPFFADQLKEIRAHHERWDGRGYPDGLHGEMIPFGACIIGLADSYDAMSFDRVYRQKLAWPQIREEIARNCGAQFDPNLAPRFLEFMEMRYGNGLPTGEASSGSHFSMKAPHEA
jgi:response regulator RpfG family c-di-GMP phosphodiesterase/signal transduction histidine kinase